VMHFAEEVAQPASETRLRHPRKRRRCDSTCKFCAAARRAIHGLAVPLLLAE